MIYAMQDRYKNLDGALLEARRGYSTQNVRLSVYPMTEVAAKGKVGSAGRGEWTYEVTDGLVTRRTFIPSNHKFSVPVSIGLRVCRLARPAAT